MKIPKTLKVGGIIYQVKRVIGLAAGREDNAMGVCDPNVCKIKLDSSLTTQALESTFLHEIIEAIDIQYDMKLDHGIISTLEVALYQVLKDNKLIK